MPNHYTEHKKYAISFFRNALFRPGWLSWSLITTLLFLICNHLLVRGRAVGIWDADQQFLQYYILVADFARALRFVYWDPWSNAGLPVLGDPQVGAFSPLQIIIGFLTGGTSSGFIVYWLFMWFLGGLGMLLLARHLRVPTWGGCVVALGFLFCGGYTGHAEHTSWVIAFSLLPFIIWRLDSALCSRKLLPAIEAGAIWGLSALAGYPGLTILTGCFSALWAIGRLLFPEPFNSENGTDYPTRIGEMKRPGTLFVALGMLLFFVVGLVVLSPTYVTFFLEGEGNHARVNALSRDLAISTNALHPGALSTFASPYLPVLKLFNAKSPWPHTDVSMCSIYAGSAATVLALFSLTNQRRTRWRFWLLCIGGLSLACALGDALPLRGWLYDLFYPMRYFRHVAAFRLYFLFIISVLALIGARDLAIAIKHPAGNGWIRFLITSMGVSLCAILVFLIISNSAPNHWKRLLILGYAHTSVAWLGICGIAVSRWLLPDKHRHLYIPLLLLDLATSDAFLTSAISRQTMIKQDPERIDRWNGLDQQHSAALDLTGNGLFRKENLCYTSSLCQTMNNDQLIKKIPVLNSYTTYENYFHLQMVSNPILEKMAVGVERIWFSEEVSQVRPTKENFTTFLRRTEMLGSAALVIHSPEQLLNQDPKVEAPENQVSQAAEIERLPAAQIVTTDLVKYSPDELVFNVQCPTQGWLLVTDRWARGWNAQVNGKQTRVYGGNFIFRAIPVSAGQNTVRFAYRPFGLPFLIILSWGTLAVVILYSIYQALRTRRTSPPCNLPDDCERL